MAITEETLRLIERMRRTVDRLADGTVRDLTEAWVRAWDVIAPEVLAAIEEILSLGDGEWPTRGQILRSSRVIRALELVEEALRRLSGQSAAAVTAAAATAAEAAAAGQSAVIISQLPAVAAGVTFGTVPADQLAAIVRRTTEQINAVHWPLSTDATDAMKRELVRGMAVGDNPRETARRMLRRCEGEFNGGLARASNIARTEILDAHRAAARASQGAAAAVLDGWMWHAKLDERTCPSCWSKHGTVYPLDEPGPFDHQSGRCARVPKTKSWADLGFEGINEPDDLTPDAEATFWALPEDVQLRIMGAARLKLLKDGDVTWSDLSQLRKTSGWRDSWGVKPVKDLAAT
jgi:SPP1 gp7 family putative phage head morphogenesis protein